jgi:hypothetical protein
MEIDVKALQILPEAEKEVGLFPCTNTCDWTCWWTD